MSVAPAAETAPSLATARRLVVKIGSALLVDDASGAIRQDWLETLAAPLLAKLPPADRTAARDEAVALLRPALCDEAGRWTADYVRLRFAARRSS